MQSAEVEAAQLLAINYFKTVEKIVSTSDKPPAVTWAEQTQQELQECKSNTNIQLTPITVVQQMPITNKQRMPTTNNVQQTPNTSSNY